MTEKGLAEPVYQQALIDSHHRQMHARHYSRWATVVIRKREKMTTDQNIEHGSTCTNLQSHDLLVSRAELRHLSLPT